MCWAWYRAASGTPHGINVQHMSYTDFANTTKRSPRHSRFFEGKRKIDTRSLAPASPPASAGGVRAHRAGSAAPAYNMGEPSAML